MQPWPGRVAASAWPLAILSLMLTYPAHVIEGPGVARVFSVFFYAAVVLFIVGAVRLGRRLDQEPALRSNTRLAMAVGAAILLAGPAGRIPWALYNWHRFENEWTPAWGPDAASWVLRLVVAGLLMALVWIAWAVLVRVRPRPRPILNVAVFDVAFGLWLLALGWLVVQMDKTSEDILHFTMPAGLTLSAVGWGVILFGETLGRLFPGRSPPDGPAQTTDPGDPVESGLT